MNFTIRILGLDRAERRLSTDWRPALRSATRAIGEMIRGRLARYPKPPTYPLRWASLRQKRFYFAMRRALGLPIKYTRHYDAQSQRLGPSWAVRDYGVTGAKVVTPVTYAPYVQADARQQPMHAATGWTTDRQAAEAVARSGDVRRVVEQAIRKALGL